MFGIQSGVFGTWVRLEKRTTNQTTLRSEIGLDLSFQSLENRSVYLLTVNITVEPRWYYNIKKRIDKGRSISNNSANYFSLFTRFHPDNLKLEILNGRQ